MPRRRPDASGSPDSAAPDERPRPRVGSGRVAFRAVTAPILVRIEWANRTWTGRPAALTTQSKPRLMCDRFSRELTSPTREDARHSDGLIGLTLNGELVGYDTKQDRSDTSESQDARSCGARMKVPSTVPRAAI